MRQSRKHHRRAQLSHLSKHGRLEILTNTRNLSRVQFSSAPELKSINLPGTIFVVIFQRGSFRAVNFRLGKAPRQNNFESMELQISKSSLRKT